MKVGIEIFRARLSIFQVQIKARKKLPRLGAFLLSSNYSWWRSNTRRSIVIEA